MTPTITGLELYNKLNTHYKETDENAQYDIADSLETVDTLANLYELIKTLADAILEVRPAETPHHYICPYCHEVTDRLNKDVYERSWSKLHIKHYRSCIVLLAKEIKNV